MKLHTHLHFDGNCKEAFAFYAKCLGGKVGFVMTYADSPMAATTPPELRSKVLHATVHVGDQLFTGADVAPGEFQTPQGFSVLLSVDNEEEAARVFDGLSEGATIQMALEETFWARRFGMLADRFGTPWMINCSQSPA